MALLRKSGRMLAIVLAGGRGKRMGILCNERPKPALPFAGRLRIIDFTLSNCIHSQISNIAVLTDYQRSNMADYLRQWHLTNLGTNGLHILEPEADTYTGTADAVYQNLDYLWGYGANAVLILAADHVYKMDYRKMLAFHEQVKADVTVGVVSVPIEQAHRFGIATTDAKGRIVDFVEKPWIPQGNLVSMGIYLFNRRVLAECLIEDAAQPGSLHDFGSVIIPRLVSRNKVFAYKFNGYWQDIGTTRAYYEANMELIRQPLPFNGNGTWPVFTAETNLPPLKKLQQSSIENSLISRGCIIKGCVENSILSPGARVEEQAMVSNSVLMANAIVGPHSVVDYCILDEGVNIGKLCYIGFGTGTIPAKRDITVLGKGVTVPPHTAIGHGCEILPNVEAADFTTTAVRPGVTVSQRSPGGVHK